MLPKVYLKPGELYFAAEPCRIETVLGSCVAVSLYCPVRQIGALCHAMLPSGNYADYKFVDDAICRMVELMRQHQVVMATVVTKLFGGANMFNSDAAALPTKYAIGEQNIRMVYQQLSRHGLELENRDVGGIYGRKVVFFSASGRIFVKQVNRAVVDARLQLDR